MGGGHGRCERRVRLTLEGRRVRLSLEAGGGRHRQLESPAAPKVSLYDDSAQ